VIETRRRKFTLAAAIILDEASKAELVSEISAYADDDLSVEMAAFEKIIHAQNAGPTPSRGLICHQICLVSVLCTKAAGGREG
jgi:hypothetical protein